MARTAINQLQDQIEAVRREAFAAGYAAAMQTVRELAAKPAPGAAETAAAAPRRGRRVTRGVARTARAAAAPQRQPRQPRQPRAAAAKPAQRTRRASAARPQRGTNARLVEEVLQSNAPRALRPAEIRTAIQRDKGVAMAFTSIRHALGQLEQRRVAEQIADSKTWRFREGGAAAD
jgi:hypothetical protein